MRWALVALSVRIVAGTGAVHGATSAPALRVLGCAGVPIIGEKGTKPYGDCTKLTIAGNTVNRVPNEGGRLTTAGNTLYFVAGGPLHGIAVEAFRVEPVAGSHASVA